MKEYSPKRKSEIRMFLFYINPTKTSSVVELQSKLDLNVENVN